jgi:hypothetical protein
MYAHPACTPVEAQAAPETEPNASDLALARLVDDAALALKGFGFPREDLELILDEAFYRLRLMLRAGLTVDVPQLGRFTPVQRADGWAIEYRPAAEILDGVSR